MATRWQQMWCRIGHNSVTVPYSLSQGLVYEVLNTEDATCSTAVPVISSIRGDTGRCPQRIASSIPDVITAIPRRHVNSEGDIRAIITNCSLPSPNRKQEIITSVELTSSPRKLAIEQRREMKARNVPLWQGKVASPSLQYSQLLVRLRWQQGRPRGRVGSAFDHRSIPPEFESRRVHIGRVFHLRLHFITFGGSSAH